MIELPSHGLQLRNRRTSDGEIELLLVDHPVQPPATDEVLIRVDATPINPSDLFGAVGAADVSLGRAGGDAGRPSLLIPLPEGPRQGPVGQTETAMPMGGEGAGVVVAAGAEAQHLLGKTVATVNGQMHAQYVTVKAAACVPLQEGTSARDGAAAFVNPFTTLLMVEHARLDGHQAIIHTAAASNLGQMLVKLCQIEGMPLVNIVRRSDQVETLRALGAEHVLDSSTPSFQDDLVAALTATGATVAFDAIGGGAMAGDLLDAMEAAAIARGASVSRYGTTVDKNVYIYGRLDFSPVVLGRDVGMRWGVAGWMSGQISQRLGAEKVTQLRARIPGELKTTFASEFTREVSLAEILKPDVLAAANRRATGEKFVILPHAGG